nr:hypothetical protein [Bacillus pumilus]
MQGFNENLFRWVNQLSIDHGYLNPLFIGLAEYTVLLARSCVCSYGFKIGAEPIGGWSYLPDLLSYWQS